MQRISAYIPCFNNADTIRSTIVSIRQQEEPVEDIVVIDDGSTDATPTIAEDCQVRVVRLTGNRGRGAARKRGMEECDSRYVLSVDANKSLPPHFVGAALPWFVDPQVAAVYGRLRLPQTATWVERWSARHIYRTDEHNEVKHNASLTTAGALCLKQLFMEAGNFDESLVFAEDREISRRLLKRGADIIFDPNLEINVAGKQDLQTALERFRRWNMDEGDMALPDYLKHIGYSVKVMAAKDLAKGDPLAAALSLFSAHYLFWRSRIHS